jgi:hypothetical protein
MTSLLYSLLTGTINIKVLPEDSCVNWGAIMLRMLPWSVVTRKDLVMSILKAMAANPQIAQEAPKLTPKMSADKIVRMAHQVLYMHIIVLSIYHYQFDEVVLL